MYDVKWNLLSFQHTFYKTLCLLFQNFIIYFYKILSLSSKRTFYDSPKDWCMNCVIWLLFLVEFNIFPIAGLAPVDHIRQEIRRGQFVIIGDRKPPCCRRVQPHHNNRIHFFELVLISLKCFFQFFSIRNVRIQYSLILNQTEFIK